jgi:glycosyltransferase involved in cell wall biosynthesis
MPRTPSTNRVEASVVIANFNYGDFLAQAIDSALGQSCRNVEVIVVDDGSTDDSREVIASFGGRITALLQGNGGQVSAFNAGFAASRGNVVQFLDADDLLEREAIATAVPYFDDTRVVKVHWPLAVIDERGELTGELVPAGPLSEGNLIEALIASGPSADVSPPTSGNAWRREALAHVYPFADLGDRHGGDAYLHTVLPLYGLVRRIEVPLSRYRIHSANAQRRTFNARIKRDLHRFERRTGALALHLGRLGIEHDPDRWTAPASSYAWLKAINQGAAEIEATVPDGQRYLLIDDQQWADPWLSGTLTPGREAVPFLEKDGAYWGRPASGEHAVNELERMHREGIDFVAVAAPAFWWLEHYPELCAYLDREGELRSRSTSTIIYELPAKR